MDNTVITRVSSDSLEEIAVFSTVSDEFDEDPNRNILIRSISGRVTYIYLTKEEARCLAKAILGAVGDNVC